MTRGAKDHLTSQGHWILGLVVWSEVCNIVSIVPRSDLYPCRDHKEKPVGQDAEIESGPSPRQRPGLTGQLIATPLSFLLLYVLLIL